MRRDFLNILWLGMGLMAAACNQKEDHRAEFSGFIYTENNIETLAFSIWQKNPLISEGYVGEGHALLENKVTDIHTNEQPYSFNLAKEVPDQTIQSFPGVHPTEFYSFRWNVVPEGAQEMQVILQTPDNDFTFSKTHLPALETTLRNSIQILWGSRERFIFEDAQRLYFIDKGGEHFDYSKGSDFRILAITEENLYFLRDGNALFRIAHTDDASWVIEELKFDIEEAIASVLEVETNLLFVVTMAKTYLINFEKNAKKAQVTADIDHVTQFLDNPEWFTTSTGNNHYFALTKQGEKLYPFKVWIQPTLEW